MEELKAKMDRVMRGIVELSRSVERIERLLDKPSVDDLPELRRQHWLASRRLAELDRQLHEHASRCGEEDWK